MLEDSQRRELLAAAHALPVTLRLGGKGLTEAVIAEAEITIEHHELIKTRISAADRAQRLQLANELADALKAELLKLIGHVAILYRPATRPKPANSTKATAARGTRRKSQAGADTRTTRPPRSRERR